MSDEHYFFLLSSTSPPTTPKRKSSLMASFPLFPLPQQDTTASFLDLLNTPQAPVSHDRVPRTGSGSSGQAITLDQSLLSSSPVSLFTDSSMTTSSSFSPGSPQMHAYMQLARQCQQTQDNLKKANEEYARLKYMCNVY
jgi:hypothetical protein